MDQPENNRDYIREIEQGLNAMFGAHLVNYSIENRSTQYPLLMLGPGGGLTPIQTKTEYTLSIQVSISMMDMIKRTKEKDLSFTRLLKIGSYTPTGVNQTQDYQKATWVMRVDYRLNDLEDFIEQLNKQAWSTYQAEFSDALEDALDDSN